MIKKLIIALLLLSSWIVGAFLMILTLKLILITTPTEVKIKEPTYTCKQKKEIKLRHFYEDSVCKIYGDSLNQSLSKQEILELWNSKVRKVPTDLMLAKGFIESSYRPYLYRYEKDLKYYYPHIKDSIQFTDLGMFQVLGMAIPHVKTVHDFPVEYQMDVFDSMMSACLIRANNDIQQAVHYYNTPSLPYYHNHNSEYTIHILNKIRNERDNFPLK